MNNRVEKQDSFYHIVRGELSSQGRTGEDIIVARLQEVESSVMQVSVIAFTGKILR